jgi:hypothetical protein
MDHQYFCWCGGVEMLEILLLQPSRPGYKRYFIPPHIHTFVLLAQDLTKDNNLHTFWGNPSLPFAIGTPSPGTKHGYIYIYISFFGTKVGIQTSQHHSRKSCPQSKVGRNYMNSFRKHSSTFAS